MILNDIKLNINKPLVTPNDVTTNFFSKLFYIKRLAFTF